MAISGMEDRPGFLHCTVFTSLDIFSMACNHERVSHAWFKSYSNMNTLNQNARKQRKKNYVKITEISASLTSLILPVEQR
jgi:hypothetical protein